MVYNDQLAKGPRLPTQHASLDLVEPVPAHTADQTANIVKALFAIDLGGSQRMPGSPFLLRQYAVLNCEADSAGNAQPGVFSESVEDGLEERCFERKVAIQFHEELIVARLKSIEAFIHKIHDVTAALSAGVAFLVNQMDPGKSFTVAGH